jgi:hypothetical protein
VSVPINAISISVLKKKRSLLVLCTINETKLPTETTAFEGCTYLFNPLATVKVGQAVIEINIDC